MFGPQVSVLCGLLILFALGVIGQETSAWPISAKWCQSFCYQRDGFFRGDEDLIYPVSEGEVLKKSGLGYWCSCPTTQHLKDYLQFHKYKLSEKHKIRKRLGIAYNSHRHNKLRNVTFYNGRDVLNYVKQSWKNFDLAQFKSNPNYKPDWTGRLITKYYDDKEREFKPLTGKHISNVAGIKIYS